MPVAAAAAVLLALVGGIVGTTIGLVRAWKPNGSRRVNAIERSPLSNWRIRSGRPPWRLERTSRRPIAGHGRRSTR